MTREQQAQFFDAYVNRMKGIMLSKGDDYAAEKDRLSNFKMSGAVQGLSGSRQCLAMIATKVTRLGELLQGKNPVNESTADSVIDLCIYGILLAMLQEESSDIP